MAVTIEVDEELERHEIDIASTGTAQVSEAVGKYLVSSDDTAVEPYETRDSDDSDNND